MKLLLCKKCHDIIRLQYEVRECKCGEVTGLYRDWIHAEYFGPAIKLGLDNLDVIQMIKSNKKRIELFTIDNEENFKAIKNEKDN